MDRKEAIFILVTNLKGRREKREPLTRIAEAVKTVLEKDFGGNTKKLAASYKVTPEIINEFRIVSKQPPEIEKMIRQRRLGLDGSTKLYSIPDLKRRIEFARAVEGLSQYDVRSIIDYGKKHPELSAKECKRTVLESETVTSDVHALVIPMESELFEKFEHYSKARRLRLEDAATEAIKAMLEEAEGTEN